MGQNLKDIGTPTKVPKHKSKQDAVEQQVTTRIWVGLWENGKFEMIQQPKDEADWRRRRQ